MAGKVPPFSELIAAPTTSAIHLEMRDAYTPSDPEFLAWKAGSLDRSRGRTTGGTTWCVPMSHGASDSGVPGWCLNRWQTSSDSNMRALQLSTWQQAKRYAGYLADEHRTCAYPATTSGCSMTDSSDCTTLPAMASSLITNSQTTQHS